eukprot:g14384.t1
MADKEMGPQSATRDVLISAAKMIGEDCVDENLAFTKCKAEHSDPEACLKLGAAVFECNKMVLNKIAKKCPNEFEMLRKCMDEKQMKVSMCRTEWKTFEEAYRA